MRLTNVLIAALLFAVGLFGQDSANRPGNMEIANPRLVVVEGAVVPARSVAVNGVTYAVPITCRFKFHAPAGSNHLAWRQATDPVFHPDGKTCEASFYHGQLTPEFQTAAARDSVQADAAFSCGGSSYCRVRFTAAFLDPVNIETTHLGSELGWNFFQFLNGDCCYTRYVAGTLDPYALAATGNQLISQWGQTGINMQGIVEYTGYTGSALFTNTYFPGCSPTQPMYAHYDPVQIYGYGDGSYDGWDNSYLDGPGGCRTLLHHTVYFTVLSKT